MFHRHKFCKSFGPWECEQCTCRMSTGTVHRQFISGSFLSLDEPYCTLWRERLLLKFDADAIPGVGSDFRLRCKLQSTWRHLVLRKRSCLSLIRRRRLVPSSAVGQTAQPSCRLLFEAATVTQSHYLDEKLKLLYISPDIASGVRHEYLMH